MKRLFNLILACLLIVSLSACGKQAETENDMTGGQEQQTQGGGNTVTGDISFNFETKTVLLNSGYEMPIYGLGTYSLTGKTCVDSVTTALNSGVRLIDTAYMYHNEESVGEAVRNSGIPREEIFVITKLYPNQFSNPEEAIEEALNKLDIDYIDMVNCDFGYTGKYYNSKLRYLEQTAQADWSRPYGKHHKLDIGAKAVFRNNHSVSDYRYPGNSLMDTHDDFTHQTTISAVYADWRGTFGKWTVRAGLRYEYSYLSARFKTGL